MHNRIRKLFSVLLASVMVFSMAACGNSGKEEETTPFDKTTADPVAYYKVDEWKDVEYTYAKEDHYRNYYEVFVYSFADSNGDGIGDINGLISKLDYIAEMGFNGIWLMPIMPATSYHKYDVENYYDIDPEFGTLDDFKNLVKECHDRNINLIIDLVFNHTSSKHPWFQTAVEYYQSLEEGQEPNFEECPEAGYYKVIKNEDVKNKDIYHSISGSDYSYEGIFVSGMPDLELSNEQVRREIEKIAKFWLDLDVDGFRLDAIIKYVSGSTDMNIEILNWFCSYVTSVKKDAYIVGEAWTSNYEIGRYYTSGLESIFDYTYGDSSGNIIKYVNQGKGLKLAESFEKTEKGYLESNPNMVNAPFVSNHDVGRISGFVSKDIARIKVVAALNQIMSGCSFVYYGEEVGMTGSGAGKDEDKRVPMPWSNFKDTTTTVGPPNMTPGVVHDFGSVEEQMKNVDSIYWYYRQILHIRSTYEEIPKGITTALKELGDESICGLKKTYNDQTMYILCNLSKEPKTITFSKDTYGYKEIVETLVTTVDHSVEINGDSITLPPYAIVFAK